MGIGFHRFVRWIRHHLLGSGFHRCVRRFLFFLGSLESLASLAFFFLDSSTSEKEQDWELSTLKPRVEERVQDDTVEVMFLYR